MAVFCLEKEEDVMAVIKAISKGVPIEVDLEFYQNKKEVAKTYSGREGNIVRKSQYTWCEKMRNTIAVVLLGNEKKY